MGKKPRGYKMKSAAHGGPMRRNFPSAFKTDPTVRLKEVTVSGGNKSERAADKFKRVKKETTAVSGGNRAANLAKEYGGNWKKGSHKDGDHIYTNESGQTVREAAISQSKAKQAKIAEYKKKNTTR